MPRKQVFLERCSTAKAQLYFIRAVLWEIFLHVYVKDGSCKEQQTVVMGSNITGEEKREKMNTLITYITLRRRRLRNLLFLLLQNEPLSQSYDPIRSYHKRSCRRYLRNSRWFSNVWETIVMEGSKLFSEFQEKHSPIYLVLFAMIYNANTFVIP